MREIKFRVWDGMIMRTDIIRIDHETGVLDSPVTVDMQGRRHKSCLMQFTGLHDKNGKEIYEGDVIRDEFGEVAPITFEVGAEGEPADYCGAYLGWCFGTGDTTGFTQADAEKSEVIGNIMENPDLVDSGTNKRTA